MTVLSGTAPWVNLEQFAQENQAAVVKRFHAVIDPPGLQRTTVDGDAAWRFAYTVPKTPEFKNGGHGQLYSVLHRDVDYVVTFTAASDDYAGTAVADFDAIMHSWKWSG